MDSRPFHIFGVSHWVALISGIVAALALVKYLRHATVRGSAFVRISLALVLILAVMADPLITYFRYIGAAGPEFAWRMVHETAWPFYLCDWAAIVCAIALITKRQRLAEIAWCWGLGATLQGLVYPASLSYDWPNPDYFAFFAEHAGVPVAGMVLVFGLGLKPEPGAAWRVWLWLLVYLSTAALANVICIHRGGYPTANYGFVCSNAYSPLGVLGPWPFYVFGFIGVLGLFFTLLTWPFCGCRTCSWRCLRPFLK